MSLPYLMWKFIQNSSGNITAKCFPVYFNMLLRKPVATLQGYCCANKWTIQQCICHAIRFFPSLSLENFTLIEFLHSTQDIGSNGSKAVKKNWIPEWPRFPWDVFGAVWAQAELGDGSSCIRIPPVRGSWVRESNHLTRTLRCHGLWGSNFWAGLGRTKTGCVVQSVC